MKAVDPVAVRDVLLLSLAAGSADAAGFIGVGHVFTSNMTGNTVLLGIAIGQGRCADAARSFYVIVVFMLGVALGARTGRGVADQDWPGLAARLIGLEKSSCSCSPSAGRSRHAGPKRGTTSCLRFSPWPWPCNPWP